MSDQPLRQRLEYIWKPADFKTFFTHIRDHKPHIIKKGTLLFSEGDPLNRTYIIKEGFLKLYRSSEEGRDATSYLLGPNYMVGIRALTTKEECARHNAEALTDLTVISISHQEYFAILAKHPEFIVDLLQVFIDRLNYTERKLEGFMLTDATARVAHFLADCTVRFCKHKKDPITLPLKLTHQLIADFVGSFRETVTIALNKLEHEKIITNNKGMITIHNFKKLNNYSS